MDLSLLKYPEFTEPYMRTANVVIDEAGGANDEGEIDSGDFVDEDYDFAVERMIVFENNLRDPTSDYGPDTQLLGDIYGRYWFRKGQTDSLPEMPVAAWDDARLDRTIPNIHGLQEPEDFAMIGMDLRRSPIIMPVNGTLTCSWENPLIVSATPCRAGTFHLAATCRGLHSGRRSTLYLPVSFLVSSGSSATGPTSKQTYQDSSKNRLDEPMALYDLRMWLDGDYGSANSVADTRVMRHVLARPIIEPGSISLCASNEMPPLVAYGWNRQLDHAVVTQDWSDEPVLLKSGDGMGFKFTNYSATKTRVFVVLAGRRRQGGV